MGLLVAVCCITMLLIARLLDNLFREVATRKGGSLMNALTFLGTMADLVTVTLAVAAISSAQKRR